MLTVIDTEASNLRSVTTALDKIGVDYALARTPDDLGKASAIILPGVGNFAHVMNTLEQRNLPDAIRQRVLNDTVPIIGICLGMQLLGDSSSEQGDHAGLGLLKGKVVRLPDHDPSYRVPNIGWFDVTPTKPGVLFPEGTAPESYYHVHSYHMLCDDPSTVAATIDFAGEKIVVAVESGHISGGQFHPEKSQDAGLDLLSRWIESLR